MLGILLALIGCQSFRGEEAWFRDQGKDYRYKSQSYSLKVPKGFKTEAFDEYYHLDPLDSLSEAEADILPPGIEL